MTVLVAIAPIPHLDELDQPISLALMHLMSDPEYARFYQMQSDKGNFIILDNSQHEGFKFDMSDIVREADRIGASEIVIPDAVENGNDTVDYAYAALTTMIKDDDSNESLRGLRPSFMVVPHGKNVSEWKTCLRSLTNMFSKMQRAHPRLLTKPLTIGFPAQYCFNVFSTRDLVDVIDALWFHQQQDGIVAHILGWDKSPWVYVPWLIERFPFRSVDTSKMFSFALYDHVVPYVSRFRGEGFFERRFTVRQLLIARDYLEEFKERVQAADQSRNLELIDV